MPNKTVVLRIGTKKYPHPHATIAVGEGDQHDQRQPQLVDSINITDSLAHFVSKTLQI